MCGRFVRKSTIEEIVAQFDAEFDAEFDVSPSFNIAPSQQVLAIVQEKRRTVRAFRWGLIPSWAKDEKIGYKMINARAESLADKPSFKQAYEKRRCLVVADGFYEWRKDARAKTPYYFHLKTGRPFGFAGLWERWKNPDGAVVNSCAIITTSPNRLMEPIHDRMPVIIGQQSYGDWLDSSNFNHAMLSELLKPFPDNLMETFPVSKGVNSPTAHGPELIKSIN
jgi:putative SOS response-associated peptidase YedK